MSVAASLAIDMLLFAVLATIGGGLVWLHVKLQNFRTEVRNMPALADDLTRALHASQKAMSELVRTAQVDGKQLETQLTQAGRTVQELVFVMDRAEKLLQRFDAMPSMAAPAATPSAAPVAPLAPEVATQTETLKATPAADSRSAAVEAALSGAVVMPQAPVRPVASASAATAAAAPAPATRRLDPGPVAVMPNRPAPAEQWARRLTPEDVAQTAAHPDTAPARTVVRPASAGFSAAVYASNAGTNGGTTPREAPVSEAERALRRALEGRLS